jgi:hypothetical protein
MSDAAALLADDAVTEPTAAETAPTEATQTETVEAPAQEVDPLSLVPESADAYELPLPAGDDGEFAKTAAEWFKEQGLNKGQAQALAAKWNEFAAGKQGEMAAAQEAAAQAAAVKAEAQAKVDDAALRNEWGERYDANVELGRRAVRQFEISADVLEGIESKVGYAGLLRMFSKIGQGLGEDTAVGLSAKGGSRSDLTAEQKLYPNMK